jgi:IclR family pca regulon transcriptional regulator
MKMAKREGAGKTPGKNGSRARVRAGGRAARTTRVGEARVSRVPKNGGRYSQSLSHGLAILASFDAESPTLGIADMADRLRMSRSTTHRYATTLAELGYLEQNSSRRYRLTPRAADLGLAMLDSMVLREPARDTLLALRRRTGRTVSLGILGEQDLLLLDRLRGWRGLHESDLRLGPAARLPLHCTAMGKVLLAYLPDPLQRELLTALTLTRYGPNTITGKRALRAELDRVYAAELAIEDEELAGGLRSIAVPVLGAAGEALAALEISVPTGVLSRGELSAVFGPALKDAAARIAAARR